MAETPERTEFGFGRTACSCRVCRRNCMFMPGFLIPSDLDRLIPAGADPLAWAEINLLASPGALLMDSRTGTTLRVPTLVPATKPNGSCVHYQQRGCAIWENSPFGCAFFDCGPERGNLSMKGIALIAKAWKQRELYAQVWEHLWNSNRRQHKAEILRERMNRA